MSAPGIPAWHLPTEAWELPITREKFDEKKHPRDPDGKFGDGIGDGMSVATDGLSPDLRKASEDAAAAIGDVVQFPGTVPIVMLDDSDSATARMRASTGEIAVADSSRDTVVNAITHETGHLLDARVLGDPDEWFSMTNEFDPLYQAMRRSPTMESIARDENPLLKGDTQMRNYFLNGREMLARAFHQYVATRTDQPELRKELDSIRKDSMLGFQFWPDDEFAPIKRELEAVLDARGVLK